MRPPRTDVLGCPVDAVGPDQVLALIADAMASRHRLCPTALNTAKLVAMRRDGELRRDVLGSDLITADGAGIVLAARLLGRPLPGRVAGIDLMAATIALAARRGFRPYLLGARPNVVEQAARHLLADHPGLTLAGWRDGYFGPGDEGAIVAAINASGADCLFVALPTPMKERFLARNRDSLAPPVIMGVGGSFDVIAGHVARAPAWMQGAGLEWLFRLMQEPRRMWRRYLVTNAVFAAWLVRALAARALGRRFAPITTRSRQRG
jgi:N-acetylglucosaminyldiphosphoundecaprenol N-acetyl-beta-D-mannosaminyltransferase